MYPQIQLNKSNGLSLYLCSIVLRFNQMGSYGVRPKILLLIHSLGWYIQNPVIEPSRDFLEIDAKARP